MGQYAEDNTDETGYSNFEAQMLDKERARWFVPDPANQYWSGYVAMGNNPIYYIDKDGRVNWPALQQSSLGILGGTLEFSAGLATVETGIGAVLLVDGGIRVGLNSNKFIDALMDDPGKSSDNINLPSNAGEAIGLLLDAAHGNNKHAFQNTLGVANDMASMAFNGGVLAENFVNLQNAKTGIDIMKAIGLTGLNLYGIYDYTNMVKSNNTDQSMNFTGTMIEEVVCTYKK